MEASEAIRVCVRFRVCTGQKERTRAYTATDQALGRGAARKAQASSARHRDVFIATAAADAGTSFTHHHWFSHAALTRVWMQQRRLRANVALISTKRASPQTPRISAGRRQEELLPSSEKINMTQQRPHGQFRDASKLLLSTLSDISLASSSPSPSSLYRRSRRVTPSS